MPSLSIPESICRSLTPAFDGGATPQSAQKHIREAVKSMVLSAIEDGLAPAPLPVSPESGLVVCITLPAKADRLNRETAKRFAIRESDAALCYLYAALARGDAANYKVVPDSTALAPYLAAEGHRPRHHQTLFFDILIDALESDGIGLVEGSTGLGKTLAMIAAAAETLRGQKTGRCVIAVPTLQLLHRFAETHNQLAASGEVADLPLGRFVVGRAEFVSVSALQTVLEEGEVLVDPLPIRAWLSKGGAATGTGGAIGSAYLLTSLRAVSPDFPVEGVRLLPSTPLEDPGAIAYAAQFERDSESIETEIIYCTHAMLGADLRRRLMAARHGEEGAEVINTQGAIRNAAYKNREEMSERRLLGDKAAVESYQLSGIEIRDSLTAQIEALSTIATKIDIGMLPPWQHLMIDEAHQFESNLANLMSFTVSLGCYFRNLQTLSLAGYISKAAIARARSALNLIRNIGQDDEYNLSDNSPTVREVRAALQELQGAYTDRKVKKPLASHPLLNVVSLQAQAIATSLKSSINNPGSRALLMYSPVRAVPQLSVGRSSVDSELSFLWGTAKSAACVSATLYLRRKDKDTGSYMASILNIPNPRLREYEPVRPAWVISPVVGLWTPQDIKINGHQWLRPPSRKDKLTGDNYVAAENAWLDELAPVIEGIHETAVGGMLVLMGSYQTAQGLAHRISQSIDEKVVANQTTTLSRQLESFVNYSRSGRRPIWFAVGGAWTGIDINGGNYGIDDPEEDNLLTDLVIPRFPFRNNRSMTHRHRMETKSAISWDLFDTAMRLKQGLGRPVRREGLPSNRRFFVLDGRVNDPTFANYLFVLYRIMNAYPAYSLNYSD